MFNLFNYIYSVFIEQRRNYKNVFNAFVRIAREEGVTTLWRGSVATMGRAVIVNISQLATYSQAKFLIATKSYYEFLNFLILHILFFFFKENISNISYINELIKIVYTFFIQWICRKVLNYIFWHQCYLDSLLPSILCHLI